MENLTIRPATPDDLPAINEIYNYYVVTCTCTFQTEPETAEGREAWFAAHGREHPVMVGEIGGRVVAWAALSPFHPRQAYRPTVEDSVYVREGLHGRGIGKAMLANIIEQAEGFGYHSIIGVICAEQTASITLHEKFGFETVGRLREAGNKFGRWLDVVFVQKMLGR